MGGARDSAAVRNTQDVDILIRRSDFDEVKMALEGAGFVYRHAASIDMFLDGDGAKRVMRCMWCTRVRRSGASMSRLTPDVEESERGADFRVLRLRRWCG